MAYRFTNTDKWNGTWFCELKPLTKLVFLYLCDQCDIAGFLEINIRKMAFDLGIGKQEVEGGLKGLGSRIVASTDGRFIFIRNFVKHQKNLPLNENNKAHRGIITRLNENLELFGYESINQFLERGIEAPLKGLGRGTGIGIGNGIGKEEDSTTKNSTTKTFKKPTLEEVEAYCKERNNSVNAQKFIDHYEARGWKYNGGTPMKDWKAAVRTWEQNSFPSSSQSPLHTGTLNVDISKF